MLTVVNVAYPLAPVGPDTVGGAEQVLSMLDAAVVAAGHRSIVIAPEGSVCRGELRPTPAATGPFDTPAVHLRHEAVRRELCRIIAEDEADVIHLHGTDFGSYLPAQAPASVLVTLHLWPDAYPDLAGGASLPHVTLVCVSEPQRAAREWWRPPLLIRNGVDLDFWTPQGLKQDFVLALGRVSPEKGFHLAIDAARSAGKPMVIAGEVFPYETHVRYFDQVIRPRLGGNVRFIGPVPREVRRDLLAGARCLAVSSVVNETSSLAAMESLASGTPVVAFRSPALEELIEDGRTGLLIDSAGSMADAITRVTAIAPATCRASAERWCSATQMTTRYLQCYEELAARCRGRPRARAAGPRLSADVISSPGDLERLHADWSDLADECSWTTPFQRPEWVLPWLRHLSTGAPRFIAVWRAGRLAGLLPLVTAEPDGGRVLYMAGTGVSDHLGSLARNGDAAGVVGSAMSCLKSMPEWRMVDLHQLSGEDPLLGARPPGASRCATDAHETCAVLDLAIAAGSSRAVPSRMSANLRYFTRKAERLGALRFTQSDPSSLPWLTEKLFALHRTRWSARGMTGVLADPSVQAFHRESLPAMHAAGHATLHAVGIDGTIAAVAYVMQNARRTFYYLGGFDPAAGALSPGTLVVGAAIEQASRDGARAFDFLRGSERYKSLWGATDQPTWRRRLIRA